MLKVSDRAHSSASLVVLWGTVALGLPPFLPDSPLRHLTEPPYLAAMAAALTAALATILRWRWPRAERVMFAAFLGGMPLTYVGNWFRWDHHGSWILVELAGLTLYATFAILGLRKSAWWLAIGTFAHGLAWDLWHHDHIVATVTAKTSVPNWYAIACLVFDLGFGAYIALQVPRWQRLTLRFAPP